MCADQFARLGCLLVSDFTLYSYPPVDIMKIFEADSQGLFQAGYVLILFSLMQVSLLTQKKTIHVFPVLLITSFPKKQNCKTRTALLTCNQR